MSEYQNLKVNIENGRPDEPFGRGICTVTINRPDKLNAINRQTVQEIGDGSKRGK